MSAETSCINSHCNKSMFWKTFFDSISFICELFGMTANLLAAALLFRLSGGTRTCIIMLRTLVFCSFCFLLLNFLFDLHPWPAETSWPVFNAIMCYIWTSRLLVWIIFIMEEQVLVFFIVNRTVHIVERYKFLFATSKFVDLGYVTGLVVLSVILSIPKVFIVSMDNGKCTFHNQATDIHLLSLVYATVDILFFYMLLANSIILALCCGFVIRWIYTTPHSLLIDTLNSLAFDWTTPDDLLLLEASKGWKTASFCIIPLSISFFLSFVYHASHQFFSGLGLLVYSLRSPEQRVGIFMLLLHSCILPLVICFYIPAIRSTIYSHIAHIMRRKQRNSGVSAQLELP